jgi:hypothetical protein
MAYYNYKRVMHRDDFAAEAEVFAAELKASDEGYEYEGGSDYDGDGWIVAARLLDKKDAEIARIQRELDSAMHHLKAVLRQVHAWEGHLDFLDGREQTDRVDACIELTGDVVGGLQAALGPFYWPRPDLTALAAAAKAEGREVTP